MIPAIHATAVAHRGASGWHCALLRGSPGAGKSDLALRLLAQGWRLVGDDYVHVWRSGNAVYATAPGRIARQLEFRGLGIVATSDRYICRVSLVVDCVQAVVERMPETDCVTLCDTSLPWLTLDIRPQSAVETLTQAMVGLSTPASLAYSVAPCTQGVSERQR